MHSAVCNLNNSTFLVLKLFCKVLIFVTMPGCEPQLDVLGSACLKPAMFSDASILPSPDVVAVSKLKEGFLGVFKL